ncbi:PDDEXK nuclease domain-containing protein [uncultured Corynebacterium sp.]|uniref:PDDEXK nuclease domain-containing protein n=1 Tax=uncultured Corynebacterium sp. TaxID=159447 RepID=UPI00345BCFB6
MPTDSFRDPYLLDFLGLQDTRQEKDLEDAIIRELESLLPEVGNGWTFVAASERVARRELD